VQRVARPHQDALSLTALVTRWLDNGHAGSRHGIKPHLTLLISPDDLVTGMPGELDVPAATAPVLLPAVSVERILCDAEITELATAPTHPPGTPPGRPPGRPPLLPLPPASAGLLPAHHHPLDVGRRYRSAPPTLRRALTARDRHCRFPDCRTGPDWCEAHHVHEWLHGGNTSLANMLLLCSAHHHSVHEGGWTIHVHDHLDPGHPHRWQFQPPQR
jgi:hypothetical protein